MSQRTGLSPSNVSEASTSSQPSVAQPSGSGDVTSPEARKYVTQACQPCRAKRSKCDNAHPTCSACVARGTLCVYSDVDRRRGKLRANETDALQERVRKVENIINVLTQRSEEEAYDLLRRMRTNPPQSLGSEGLAEWTQAREREGEFNAPAARVYTVHDLPPEHLIQYGIRAFFSSTYTLFYIYEKQEMDDLLNRVYRTHEAVDNATLCELCAAAAVGSHYDGDKLDGPVLDALFQTATIYMSDCIESQFLRGMRVLLCLGIVSSLTKRTSARLSIASGLRLARWARLQQQDILPWVAYRKVYRSLVFMECWLASTLGYQPDLSHEEAEKPEKMRANTFFSLDPASGQAFSACSVLLFAAAQRLLYDQRDSVQVYLSGSQECINMLASCSVVDRVANSLLQIVRPLHQDLQRLASTESSSRPKSGIYDLLENPHADAATSPPTTAGMRGWSPGAQQYQGITGEPSALPPPIRTAAIPAMQHAIEVLGNPFGLPRRLNTDSFAAGDPIAPSWS
ncbi:hypothetical protein AYO21_07070 [Fonsecaea monophora]|uniref:Zn(2)-C6 fungal-type domain-containing protein n=1 Tax=Fonsecaea monophora TaxID=254056 RepID=A0A177F304_9EURO|nr:hypothetical protein AYO21_07070 [Fonsecaea monophora]OAG38717.1 hypothetical protein AYO21_07070 [Fonsecaea monophora]